ncbi:MAG: hypothetical protein ACYS8Y_12425 [Planctomycetota bacterium]|jgi:hypothetical protein
MGKAYQKIRKEIEALRGSMTHEKKGHPRGGVWIVKLNQTRKKFKSTGGHYPGLDELYVPKPGVKKPKGWSDYTKEIDPKELNKLLKQFK